MFLAKKIIAALLLPPLGPLLIVALGLALLRRRPRLGQTLAWGGAALLYAVSISAITRPLLATLENHPPVDPGRLREAQAIVVLGAGLNRNAPEYGAPTVSRLALERVRYGARLARVSGLPVLVSGGPPWAGGPAEAQAMADTMQQDFGVAPRWLETAARDTRDNATQSAALLRSHGIRRVILVSHAWHMRRAVPEFVAAGLDPIPAPTGFASSVPLGIFAFLPSDIGVANGYYALHEWLGILAQRLVGIGG